MSPREWLGLYESESWAREVADACRDVAACQHAVPTDREQALGILGAMIGKGLIEESALPCSFPVMVRDVHMQLVRGRPKVLDAALRELCSERIEAVKMTLHATGQFTSAIKAGSATAELPMAAEIN